MVKVIDKKVLRDLWLLRSQIITIAIVVMCGIAILISSWSSFSTLTQARDKFYSKYRFADVFAEMKRAPRTVLSSLQKIEGINDVELRCIGRGLIQMPDMLEPATGLFVSLPVEGKEKFNLVHINQGRKPQPGTNNEVVAHESFAEAHSLKLGSQFQVNFRGELKRVTVVGIGNSPEYVNAIDPAAPLPDKKHFGVFWMNETQLETLLDMSGAFNSLAADLKPGTSESHVKREIDQIISKYGGIGSYGRDKQLSNSFVSDEISQQRITATVMPAIFLGVAAFLLNVILSRLLSLQRGQIATLKACGFSNIQVAIHYSKLVGVIVLIGGFFGIIAGIYLGWISANMYKDFFKFSDFKYIVSWQAFLGSLSAALIAGAIGALGAIREVIKLSPAEAMRPPSPPSFHKTWVERSGFIKKISPVFRMPIRNLYIKPIRLLFSEIGIAASISIMVMAICWYDVIGYIVESQFSYVDRSDLTIALLTPQNQNALDELKMIDGVLETEGYRSIGVRLRYQQFNKETALNGIPINNKMHKLLDLNLKEIRLPEEGLVLSAGFRDKWNLKEGDLVEIEEIAGQSRKWILPVTGFVEDLIGYGAYIKQQSLWKMIDESGSFSTVRLRINNNKMLEISSILKNRPEVSSVFVKGLMLQGFKETMAKVALTFTYILIGFAVAIAVGVVYNNARVSLSERTWELVSLRILGFTKGDVFRWFFSELMIQVVLALPLGWALGYFLSWASTFMINTETFRFPLIITMRNFSMSTLVVLMAFVVSMWFVNRRLKKLPFSEALKSRE